MVRQRWEKPRLEWLYSQKKYGKPVLAFAGAVERDAGKCNEHGIDAFFPILRGVVTLEEAMKNENAKRNLADTAEQVYRTFTIL